MAPNRGKGGAQRIQSLEPCKHDARVAQPVKVLHRLQARSAVDTPPSSQECQHVYQYTGHCCDALSVQFPIGLVFGAGATGIPDLRIELIRLRWGDTGDAHTWGPTDLRGPWQRAHAPQPTRWSDSPPVASRLSQCASTTGALLLFSILHRDAAAAVGPSLVLPGLAVAAAEVAAAVVDRLAPPLPPPPKPPRTAQQQHPQHPALTDACAPSSGSVQATCDGASHLRCSQGLSSSKGLGGASEGRPAQRPQTSGAAVAAASATGGGAQRPRRPGRGGLRRRLGGLASGLGRMAGPAAALLERILVPSALLSLAGRAWRVVHASSAALAEAVADLATVGLSYSCLARQAQLGRLPPGYVQEMAWRRLHKAAAQRLAHHLADLPASPPLGPALATLQRCSIAAGLAVDGVPLCGALDALKAYDTAGGSGSGRSGDAAVVGGAGGSGRRLLLSFSYCCQRQPPPPPPLAAAAAVASLAEAAPSVGCISECSGGVPNAVAAGARPTITADNSAATAQALTHPGSPQTAGVTRSPQTAGRDPPGAAAPLQGSCEIAPLGEQDSEAPGIAAASASPLTSTSSEGDDMPAAPQGCSYSGRRVQQRPPPSSPPQQRQEGVRRQTAPGQIGDSASPADGAASSHLGHVLGSAGGNDATILTAAAAAAAAAAATSSAARRGLPRAASASSLRAITSQPPPPPAVPPPPPAVPPPVPPPPARPSVAGSTPARLAAAVVAPPSRSRRQSAAAPVSAATDDGGGSGGRRRTASPQPPSPPRVCPADGYGVTLRPHDSNGNSESTSWGSAVSCTAQSGTGRAVAATAAIATTAAVAALDTGGDSARGAGSRPNGDAYDDAGVGSYRSGGPAPAAAASGSGEAEEEVSTAGGSGSGGTGGPARSGQAAAPAAAPSPAASLWRFVRAASSCASSKPAPSGGNCHTSNNINSGRSSNCNTTALPASSGAAGDWGSNSNSGGDSGGGGGLGAGWELPALSLAEEARLLRQEQAAVEALGLPLYGRTDHVGTPQPAAAAAGAGHHHHHHHHNRPLGLPLLHPERLGLACRAAYLLAVFAPFLTLGVALLLMSAALLRSGGGAAAAPAAGAVAGGAARSGAGAGTACRRRAALALRCRRGAWVLLLGGCRRAGAAFIKWGQWSATRVDLFPDDFCEALSSLHDRAPTHSFAFTRRQVERSFGVPLDRMFEAFDPRPVASGSIAQVHRALMRRSDGSPLEVAVKVVHPHVETRIRQDFALLQPAAAALGRLRSLRSLSLPETVSQFSCTMTAQADLRVEAAHLRRFYANFSGVASQVTTPRPLPGLVRRDVMVESWEAGASVSTFIRCPGPLNTAVVCLGVDTYLKMLLQDNFVHTDLHPGNIMVRLVCPDGRPLPPEMQRPTAAAAAQQRPPASASASASASSSSSSCSASAVAAPSPSPSSSSSSPQAAVPRVQLVLLDFGLAEELTPVVRHHFISFLHHLLRGDGAAAASHLLRWTSRRQACPDPPAFVADMAALAASRCDVHSGPGVDLDAVLKDVLRLARRHAVTIDSAYASLVIAVCVIVGFATSLDPRVNLVDAAVPALLAHALTGRVVGRLYS